MNNDELGRLLAKELLKEAVIKAVKHYGLEGTEEAIKRTYVTPGMLTLRRKMLNTYYDLYKLEER
ncbi:MAG: hypothetical protein DRO67_09075 [Candidatus Asgardarchaeum californiense]|nr:MAG: hypothetical protein DRO67_09075 [Candidatus Asgardarchaeum californiense]